MCCARTRLIVRFFHRQETGTFGTRLRDGTWRAGAAGPAVQGPLGMSTAGREAKSSASGQAAAEARRTRLALSTARAAGGGGGGGGGRRRPGGGGGGRAGRAGLPFSTPRAAILSSLRRSVANSALA